MIVDDLKRLFDYGYWANRKLFDVLLQLTPEQFAQALSGSHGCIRNTLVHTMSAEWGWLSRCGGADRGPALDPANFPTPASVLERWNEVERSMRNFLSTLRDANLTREIEFTVGGTQKYSMSLGELLQHAANHGVHHRGQISLLVRLLGYSPENFDILFYFAEKRRAASA